MEYAPNGHFIDLPSVAVLNRDWPACAYAAHDPNGWLELSTQQLRLKYQLGSGPFRSENMVITWNYSGEHSWRPGDVDDENLGGVPGEIQGRIVPGRETGPLSRNGYYLLNDSTTAVWNPETHWPERRPDRDGQDWYFFCYGHDYKRFFYEATRLMGTIPMVPRYVLGTWFGSRAGYPEDECKRICLRFREAQIPLDVFVLTSDTDMKIIWAGYDWDYEQFPDPVGFFQWSRAHGIKTTTAEHYSPLTAENDSHFEQVRRALQLPADTKEIPHDISNQRYAELFMDLLHKPALQQGLDFWWQDGSAESSMPGLDHTLWTRHVEYEGDQRITGKRGFVFCRLQTPVESNGPAWGVHRYGSFFTGDLIPYWSTLELLVPFNVQSGNMLVPYVNNLLAGVLQETLDHELYRRWVQFGAFSPLFWWDGLWGLRLPWEYDEDGMKTVTDFLRIRYRLLPYTYTYTRIAHETGTPHVRGTWLEYPEQEKAYEFQHQYLFGAEILVAPITRPGQGQPVTKDIYLPDGDHWYDWFTEEIHAGGQVLGYECPLSRMPLFVRGGSILPMSALDLAFSDEQPLDPLRVDIYAGKPATFRLYEDDGTSLGYQQHAYAWTPIAYKALPTNGDHIITVGPVEGRFSGQVTERRYRLRIHGLNKPASVLVGEQPLKEMQDGDLGEGWIWQAEQRVTEIVLAHACLVSRTVAVTLRQAGRFEDRLALHKVLHYRERVRKIKIMEKLRWAMLLQGRDIKKEPHVLQVTDQIEQRLDDLVDNPEDMANRMPDFRAFSRELLTALVTQPFDSSRKIPELDAAAQEAMRHLADKTFTEEELHRITGELLDCRLIANAKGGDHPKHLEAFSRFDTVFVTARFAYDTASATSSPAVDYELTLPKAGDPGWAEEDRSVAPDGAVSFMIRPPFPIQQGTYWFKLRATADWGLVKTIVESDVPCVIPPNPQG
jgi:alpha-glucosidase (family GH31 glycosyl hydrolase)